jgi:hypothetical protein
LKRKGENQFELHAAGYPDKDGSFGKIITLETESKRARDILLREIHWMCAVMQSQHSHLQEPKMKLPLLSQAVLTPEAELNSVLGAITTTAQNFRATI